MRTHVLHRDGTQYTFITIRHPIRTDRQLTQLTETQ
ncbi:MAG: hypothetical protein J07HQX50_01712 [Haloquadratum sp. J07HQX50]|nr:MAG: hypothetical protein J07HQX50_01712 [Haloquadratum sp. J07HQX50]